MTTKKNDEKENLKRKPKMYDFSAAFDLPLGIRKKKSLSNEKKNENIKKN
jgi:hypothetical protein